MKRRAARRFIQQNAMQHFVVPPDAIEGHAVLFSADQARQITRVLRLHDSDEVVVLDGVGAQSRARLVVEGRGVCGEVIEPAADCHEPARRVTLLVAPPKGERWEWLLQKGAELGVAAFAPVVARYSQPGTTVVKPRHREIVREATEQCRRLLVPRIEEPRPFAAALETAVRRAHSATILLWEEAGASDLAATIRSTLQSGDDDVTLVIGPEGGFHPDEVTLARELGVSLAGLGPLILRTETAAIVAAALTLNE